VILQGVESADVVIIGGGAVGASTAFQLALRGVTDVVLLERGQLAGGSTAKSAGGARLQFADELNIAIGERGMRDFEHWPEVIGPHVEFVPDIAFHQVGYLFLLGDDEQVATFRKALEVQHRLGVPSRLLTPQEAAEIVPQLVIDDLVAATFCPRDGHMSPEAVVQGYAAAAAAHGVTVRQGSSATGITVSGGTITAVETDQGTIATDTVVCASGAWSGEVCAMAGVDVPVTGEARWMWFSPETGMSTPAMAPTSFDHAPAAQTTVSVAIVP